MIPLYGNGMHDYLIRVLEIGERAAAYEDSERCGWSALDDIDYKNYLEAHPPDVQELSDL